MNINDTVITKKTGYPASGIVVGIIRSDYYLHQVGQPDTSLFNRWNNLYPDWFDKSIVYVLFEEAIPPVTFEEYVEGMPEDHKKYVEEHHLDVRTLYETQVTPRKVIAYPIDDLEVI